ncbi:NAD-P-binding protein [Laetiporus sulphureus 93-53]|uniref:NAD-P-binding protein n=1 Tax=Laetiporus sulphureus 93-53 TaxID=1314785 RepID=A0A165F4H8_9APHY|nr:NAD-P-binding protein [Laetiporus sulphureus 93-53]KZT08369.1 NAD-P-binding protein [Laetiporus sulphureus 93-53]
MSESKPNPYAKNKVAAGGDDFVKRTVTRLQQIQSQLETTPRSGRLRGKVCVITGVGSMLGIGRATALQFAHEGAARLYLIDYDPTNLPNLKSTIEQKYPDVKVTTIQADATDEGAISGVCKQAVQEEGRLDVFFANAGIATTKALHGVTAEAFMRTLKINTLSCFLAVRYASEAMMKTNPSRGKDFSGGSIIMTASVAGIRSGAGPIDYSASKAAVNNMAQTAAYQLPKTDIRVNSICPGLIETGMTVDVFNFARSKGAGPKIGQLNPLGRYGVAQEVANVVTFLASDESSYVNGQNIAVDGGLSSSVPVVPGRWS